MEIIYVTASKNGKEPEKEFSTLERAEADLWAHDYYLGCVIHEAATTEEVKELAAEENANDLESAEWMEETALDRYRAYQRGIAA